jgi:hypothetical protein
LGCDGVVALCRDHLNVLKSRDGAVLENGNFGGCDVGCLVWCVLENGCCGVCVNVSVNESENANANVAGVAGGVGTLNVVRSGSRNNHGLYGKYMNTINGVVGTPYLFGVVEVEISDILNEVVNPIYDGHPVFCRSPAKTCRLHNGGDYRSRCLFYPNFSGVLYRHGRGLCLYHDLFYYRLYSAVHRLSCCMSETLAVTVDNSCLAVLRGDDQSLELLL